MKVYVSPHPETAPHGLRRVLEALYRYLPEFGIELVDNEADADLVNIHSMAFVETSKPVVYSSHGLHWGELTWPYDYLKANQLMIDQMKRAQAITAVSEWNATAIRRGIMKPVEVIYHGIDPEEWDHDKQPQGYALWNKARADVVCDPDEMNQLAELLPNVGFVSTLGKPAHNVQITGPVPYEQMFDMVQKAGVYLALARETFGIGTLEALAAGVPVVGWDHGGTAEIFRESIRDIGRLVPYGDYEALATAVTDVLSRRNDYTANCKLEALEWEWDRFVAQYAYLFERVYREHTQERPDVSVVVTAHNLGKYLPDALNSVLDQTFQNWECLIVDDSSTDNTPQIAAEFVANDPRFTYLPTPSNLKLSGARNYGFSKANGRFILFLDADDKIAPEALGIMAMALDHDPGLHIAYGHLDVINEAGEWVKRNNWPFDQFDWLGQMAHLNQLPYCAMMRREVMEQSGGYRVRDHMAEDAAFWCRVTSFGFNASKVTDRSLLLYRVRGDSKSATERNDKKTAVWNSWYPWRIASDPIAGDRAIKSGIRPNPALVPFGAQGKAPNGCWPVFSHADPLVSVIIPVGPGHDKLLIDALDSLIAQTFPFWEAVVINDTKQEIDTRFAPWARVIVPEVSGVAGARNAGIRAAKSPLLLFLDADDILVPTAVQDMVNEYATQDGAKYIYSDWVNVHGAGDYRIEKSKEYDRTRFDRSMHPISALVPKQWAEAVGGFDESLPGWEDWDFFIKLAVNGYCGTRLPRPLLVYRLMTGERRDDSITKKDQTLGILRERYAAYIEGGKQMAKCCGGGSGPILEAKRKLGMLSSSTQTTRGVNNVNGLVRIEYLGINTGPIRISSAGGQTLSKTYTAAKSALHRYHDATPEDAKALVNTGKWKYIDAPAIDLDQTVQASQLGDGLVTAVNVTQAPQPTSQPTTGEAPDPDAMTASQIRDWAVDAPIDQVTAVLELEKAGKNRTTAVKALELSIETAAKFEEAYSKK